jgi:hypothetical protein
MGAGQIFLFIAWWGLPAFLGLFWLSKGCREIGITRKLKKHGRLSQGKIVSVTIRSRPRIGAWGVVSFTYLPRGDIYTQTAEQTVHEYYAARFLGGKKEVDVLFLPEKPEIARLDSPRSDYKSLRFDLTGGLILCTFYLPIATAVSMALWFSTQNITSNAAYILTLGVAALSLSSFFIYWQVKKHVLQEVE